MPVIATWMAVSAVAATSSEEDERLLAVGLHVGPRIDLDGLGVAILPRAELGVLVPGTGERLLVFTTVGFAAPRGAGAGTDPRVGGPYDWNLTLNQVQVGLGIGIDLAADDWKVHPELSVAPQLWFFRAQADGSTPSATFGTYNERWTTVGGLAALSVGYDLGPGRLLLRGEGTLVPVNATIPGKLTSFAVTPTLGYRFLF